MVSVTRYQVSQSIPFPGKLSAKAEIVENKTKSAFSDSSSCDASILSFFYNQKALELNERLINFVKGTVESTKARYKTGESEHHEWLLAKSSTFAIGCLSWNPKCCIEKESQKETGDPATERSVGSWLRNTGHGATEAGFCFKRSALLIIDSEQF